MGNCTCMRTDDSKRETPYTPDIKVIKNEDPPIHVTIASTLDDSLLRDSLDNAGQAQPITAQDDGKQQAEAEETNPDHSQSSENETNETFSSVSFALRCRKFSGTLKQVQFVNDFLQHKNSINANAPNNETAAVEPGSGNDKNLKHYLVIDVRKSDLDYLGGHIRDCVNIEHSRFISEGIASLIKNYAHCDSLIFHCMYSQSRGPACVNYYCLAVTALLKYYYNQQLRLKKKNSLENVDLGSGSGSGNVEAEDTGTKEDTAGQDQEEKEFENIFVHCARESDEFVEKLNIEQFAKEVMVDEQIYQQLTKQNVYLLHKGFQAFINLDNNKSLYVDEFDEQYWNLETVADKTELYHKTDW